MSLNERKIKILQAIVNDYIATAEPVGSRTIAKKYNLGISSATIRNEMSDLEEMGFIIQPHASSGRIPSDMGYRLYVDHLMQRKELEEEEEMFLRSVVSRNISSIDFLMEETAKALSTLTNYTAIVSESVLGRTQLKQIRLLPLDSTSVIAVIATEGNYIKNYVIKLSNVPNERELHEISFQINNTLRGNSLADIDSETLYSLEKSLGNYGEILNPLLDVIEQTIHSAENVQVHLSGTKNILAFPEFSDLTKAKSLFQSLEEKEVLVTLLGDGIGSEVQIMIGNENSVASMKGCSVITVTYQIGENTKGTIGILGPTRMDYSQVISALNGMVSNIERVLKSFVENKDDS